jgi:membrane-bound lytic murein transglycosylase B
MNKIAKIIFFTALIILANCKLSFDDEKRNFYLYKQKLYVKALKDGYSPDIIEKTFNIIKYSKKHIAKDRKQFTQRLNFNQYYNLHINEHKIKKAKKKFTKYNDILLEIATTYKISPEYIIALWGIESDFGNITGNNYMVNSLVNLAFEGRRREFFEKEFFASLEIISMNKFNPKKLKSSWAGAIGQCQFMPSTYLNYAIDFDNDNIRDIWDNENDVFASIANYLSKIGFNNELPFGYEIKATDDLLKFATKNKNKKFILNKLNKKYIIEKIDDSNFSEYELKEKVEIITYNNRIFINFNNFNVLKKWNNSNYFALTVGIFAEKIKLN